MSLMKKFDEYWFFEMRHWPVIREARELFWALQHRFNPKHRYNVIYLKLKPGYYDPDTRLKHAVFEEVTRWIETNQFDLTATEHHARLAADLGAVRDWWKTERPKMVAMEDTLLTDWYEAAYGKNPKNLSKEEIAWLFEAHRLAEQGILDTDRFFMKRAIENLDFLWY